MSSAADVDIATTEEVLTILAAATASLSELLRPEADHDDPARGLRVRAGIEAIRFASAAAELTPDPSLLGPLAEALALVARSFDNRAPDHPEAIASGMRAALRMGVPVGETVHELADHPDVLVRGAVAAGLLPASPRAIALLERLAGDPVLEVRRRAKEALAEVTDTAWWRGKLASDPSPRLSPREARRLKPSFEKLSRLLDEPLCELRRREAELVRIIDALPDALALEVGEVLMSSAEPEALALHTAGAAMLARRAARERRTAKAKAKARRPRATPAAPRRDVLRPGAAAALKRLLEAWGRKADLVGADDRLTKMLLAIEVEARLPLLLDLVASVVESTPDERCEGGYSSPPIVAAAAIRCAWPHGADPTPIVEAVLVLSEHEGDRHDHALASLAGHFAAPDLDWTPCLDRAIEAYLAGCPGGWAHFRDSIERGIEAAPAPARRAAVERAIASDRDGVVAWGVLALLGSARDPERDPPRADLVRQLFVDRRIRRAMLHSSRLLSFGLPLFRMELRGARLGFDEAVATIRAVRDLFGDREGAEPGATEQKVLDALDDVLGPPELRGPPVEEEWSALRAARVGHPIHGHMAWLAALHATPPGPWHPDDRAFLDHAIGAFEGGASIAYPIASAIAARPEPLDLPLLDRLLGAAEDDERGLVRRARKKAYERLGLPIPPDPEDGEEGSDGEEDWEDDDGED